MSHLSPKRWLRPRSRRWREAHGPRVDNLTVLIIKDVYQSGEFLYERPEWARIARARGWMTVGAYYSLKPVITKRRNPLAFPRSLYADGPFHWMLSRGLPR